MPRLQVSLRAGAAVFALALGTLSMAAPTRAQSNLIFPSASLSQSLNALSRASGVEILADPTLLRGKKAPAVRGAANADAALSQLLRGSGLGYEKRGSAFLIVSRAEALRPISDAAVGRTPVAPPAVRSADTVETATDETIVVTGSRIARPELESAMPISIVNMEQAERAGRIGAYDVLRLNPAVAPGLGAENAVNSGDAGAFFVDLRGLGTNRSLTLVDGMRRVSSGSGSSAVDIGMIPSIMIDRIEVVTGGAAAIYGADAVTGATNVITKDYLDGLHASATQGVTKYGDGRQTYLSLATGGQFDDARGSFIIGGTYTNTGNVAALDRKFSKNYAQVFANPANTGPNDGIPDNIIYYDLRSQSVNYDPSYLLNGKRHSFNDSGPIAFRRGAVVQPEAMYDGGDGRNLMDQQQLRGAYESYSFIAKAGYEITDTIRWQGRLDYGRSLFDGGYINSYRQDSRANQVGGRGGDRAYLDNPYLPDFLRAVMVENNLTALPIERSYGNFPRIEANHDRESFTTYQGLGGALGNFSWEAFWQYGRATDEITFTGIPQVSHIAAARDAIADPDTDQPICRDPAARAQGCVPYSIFSQQALTAEQHGWLFGHAPVTKRTNTQHIFGGNIGGNILDLPYGPLALVAGTEYRREKISLRGDGLAQQSEFTHAPLGVDAFQPPMEASQSVTEFFGEMVLPLLKDLPFAHRLEIEAAYRYSDYSTGNRTHTWKAGGSWEPVEGLAFRGVRSRSVRAPNFGELYSPRRFVDSGQPIDPCAAQGSYYASATRAANCAALGIASPLPQYAEGPTVASGGNPDLDPETSNSMTIGVVARPKFLPGFDLSIDYWDIGIDNVVASFGTTQVFNLCVDLPTVNNVFCDAQTRDPVTRKLATVNTFLINAQKLTARGFDLGMNYRRQLGRGMFHAGAMGSLMTKRLFETTPGEPAGNVDTLGNASTPKFKGTLVLNYSVDNLFLTVTNHFISAGKFDLTDIQEPMEGNRIPAYNYTDISFGVDIDDRFNIMFGVNNILNTGAPVVPYSSGPLNAGGYYNVLGRYAYATVKIKL